MPGRHSGSGNYRYGFGGQEKDDEVHGVSGSSYTAEFWQYDSRLGRRWNRDPVVLSWQSNYATFNNNPIIFNDPKGLFGTRKEARKFAKANGGGFRLRKFGKGEFALQRERDGAQFAFGAHSGGFTFKGTKAEQAQTRKDIKLLISSMQFQDDFERGGGELVFQPDRAKALGSFLQFALPSAKLPITKSTTGASSASPKLLGTTRDRLLGSVKNTKLKRMVDFLYRPGARHGNGSTGSMIRIEKAESIITSASGSHIQKAEDALVGLKKLLKNGNLSDSDRKIIFEIVEDLTTGTGIKF